MGSIKTSSDPLLTRTVAAGTERADESSRTIAAEKRVHQTAPAPRFNGSVSSFNGWFVSF